MAFKDLDVRIPHLDQIQLRHLNNRSYFSGAVATPTLASKSKVWLYVGYALAIGGTIATIATLGIFAYIWLFTSPFAVEVEGIVDGRQPGRIIEYHYEVDGVRYDKDEITTRISKSSWDNGNVPEPVIYLSFMPSVSRLEVNTEEFDAFLAFFAILFLLILAVAGFMQIREYRRTNQLILEASHILPGTITFVAIGQKRLKTVTYKTISPETGNELTGNAHIGVLESVYKQFVKDTSVAILYANDKLHAIL